MKKLIAFCGKSGTGKTTMAYEVLKVIDKLEKVATTQAVYSLATPLKSMTMGIEDPVERRKSQQALGDSLRAKNPRAMISALESKIELSAAEIIAVDDIRTLDEERWVKEKKGILIELVLPEEIRIGRLLKRDGKIPDDAIKTHMTETTTFNPHYRITNASYTEVQFLLEFILRVDSGWYPMQSAIHFAAEYIGGMEIGEEDDKNNQGQQAAQAEG